MDKILELKNITKRYPGVIALNDVSLSFVKGEVHAIAGENGAGKSTFIKIITGAIQPTEGEVYYNGQILKENSPIHSLNLGIAAIYQEFNLFPFLSVAENIFYGRYPKKGIFVDYERMYDEAQKIVDGLGIEINAREQVKNLSVGYQQIVEIAKAISRDVKVLIMDEPSAPLTENEISHLFHIVRKLKEKQVTIIYISHRMEEIFKLCDNVSVFRDGTFIRTMKTKDTNEDELVQIMVNRELGKQFPNKDYIKGEMVLEVKNLSTELLNNVNFKAYRGEILGLAGLVGAGRTEVARALFGADKIRSGQIAINGQVRLIRSPEDAIKAGIGLIPEDRKKQGILLKMSVKDNISYANMKGISKYLFINEKKDTEISEQYTKTLKIKTPSEKQLVEHLSGGNQQKVVLAKWMFVNSDILIFDEPTRGIDVGAKQEIYQLMNKLVENGKVIIMISSEMPELIGMADRILVMHEGRMTGELMKEEFSQEAIMKYSSGIGKQENLEA